MNRFLLLTGMILVAAASKFVPHPVNFAPIGAIALFAGAHFVSKRAAFLVPLLALLIGDLVTELHSLIPFVYGCFALNVLLGFWIKRHQSTSRVLAATLIGAGIFFLVRRLRARPREAQRELNDSERARAAWLLAGADEGK